MTEQAGKELLAAAKDLRAAQRAYMADRGNNALGRAVAEAASALDVAIFVAEESGAAASPQGGTSE